jgi:hypothetical protein
MRKKKKHKVRRLSVTPKLVAIRKKKTSQMPAAYVCNPAGGVAQVVEHLSSKCEILKSNPSTATN